MWVLMIDKVWILCDLDIMVLHSITLNLIHKFLIGGKVVQSVLIGQERNRSIINTHGWKRNHSKQSKHNYGLC